MNTFEEIAKSISENIKGWCGANGASLLPVGYMVAAAQGGDHLEIGSLWGASAIMAALVKKQYGFDGKIYCVDPMEYKRHEPCSRRANNVTPERAKDMPNVFMRNIEAFGVSDVVTLIQKPSQPFPEELTGKRFSTVFIDGWHYGNTPTMDVRIASDSANDLILLDDAPLEYYPAVERAFRELVRDKRWIMQRTFDRSVLFRRRQSVNNIWWHTAETMTPEEVRL